MHSIHRRVVLAGLLAAPALRTASAQEAWPARPVQIINPWPAGGSSDTMARLFAQRFSTAFGQQFVVDNRAGASGTIGHGAVARARPDGYTLLFATNSTYAIAPHLISPLPYDNRAGFTGISLVGRTPQALCVHPGLPVNNIAEFLAYVRARPEQVSFSSAGIGASSHLASEMLMAIAGLKMLHVPYRGGAPSMQAVVAGETQMSFIDAVSSLPHRAAGTLKLLAVGTATRSSLLPELPTLAESGVVGFDSSTDMALMGPAGLSSVVVERLAGAVRAAVDDPAFRQQMITQGTEPIGDSPAEFDEYWTRELAKWGEVIRSRGIRAAG